RSCDQGCAGGILLSGDRFLTVERLERRARNFPHSGENNPEGPDKKEILEKMELDPIEPARVFHLDDDREKAVEKMAKLERITGHLPAIDCGACGAPNCHALAEDMIMGKAKMTDCVYLQCRWQKEGRMTSRNAYDNLEKIWGNGRFDVNHKKGGK
ncbi:MAG TPA: (Fe-S)-binding protein, partial [Prolixibacteraceae bacterium]|nr:(Fe-S)-binding protein [Prolixibacteraceae bacterium]